MTRLDTVNEAAIEDVGAPASRLSRRRARLLEAAWVAGLLVALECVIFWGYFAGDFIPPWDFLGSYNTEAYAWWSSGSFFNPTEWIPHAWGGYPAAASIQNSAWYLPVGLASLFTPFTIHASAALAAVHYGFGALGVYVLGRAFGLGRAPSTFGLTAFFFVSGFFAQAEYVDIARGYAWLPWILLCTSTRWPWRRWWGIPLAVLMLWQALLGTYPGMIVAIGYCTVAWVVVQQVTTRLPLRRYLVPLALTGVATVMLLAPKYIPSLLLDTETAAPNTDSSVFGWSVLATAFLPYGSNPVLPNDIAMRSFFLPVTCFVLVALAGGKSALARATTAVLAVAVVLGLPNLPFRELVDSLPGLSLSRFRMSDFRAAMLLAVCLLAMAALHRLMSSPRADLAWTALRGRWVGAWLALLPAGVLTLALANGFDASEWTLPVLFATAGCAVVWLVAMPLPAGVSGYRLGARPAAAILLGLTIISGVHSAYATAQPWRAPRLATEDVSFGGVVDDLIAQDTPEDAQVQRPPRAPAPADAEPHDLIGTVWNAGYYMGTDSVGGLVNLKRNTSYEELHAALLDPERAPDANALYSAPGIVLALDEGQLPRAEDVSACVTGGDCGDGFTMEPVSYESGDLAYRVHAEEDVIVALNESYYLGWRLDACPIDGGECQELQAIRGPVGTLSVALPAGSWDLGAEYVPPGSRKAWASFWAGLVLVGGASAFVAYQGSRRGRHPAPEDDSRITRP